jgi:hypothetical protein
MTQLAHLASGALLGQQVSNPALAFGFGVGAHLLIDKIPHFWPASKKWKRIYTVVDYILAYSLLFWVILNYKTNSINMIFGALGSLAVDDILVGIPAVYKSKLGQWHTSRQPHKTDIAFIVTDIIMFVICMNMLVR